MKPLPILTEQQTQARKAAQKERAFVYRRYIVVPIADVAKVDVAETPYTSTHDLRKSLDGTLAIAKWDDGDLITPEFLKQFPGATVLTQDEALTLVATEAWTDPKAGIR